MVIENWKRLGRLFWDKGLVHVLLSLFAGTWVLALIASEVWGSALAIYIAMIVMSLEKVIMAALSLGFTWLVSSAFQKPLPLSAVKIYWLSWALIWVFSAANIWPSLFDLFR